MDNRAIGLSWTPRKTSHAGAHRRLTHAAALVADACREERPYEMRSCYICGRPAERRNVIDPLMVPVCFDRECAHVAALLPALHCSARLATGQLCGAPATPHMRLGEVRLCATHMKRRWDAA